MIQANGLGMAYRALLLVVVALRACLIIRGSKRNLMKMRTHFHKFSVNSRTIDINLGGIGAIFMELQPIHQLSNRL